MDRPDRPRPPRAALIELAPREPQPAARGSGGGMRTLDVHGWPLSVGRALDNDLVLDDPSVAAHHARIEQAADGSLTLQVLDTVNGATHLQRHVAAGQALALPPGGTTLQFGNTVLRLRLPGEVLAAETPLAALAPRRWRAPLAAGAAAALLAAVGHWVELDPGADFSAWLPLLMGLPLMAVGWCAAWALMSKLFQHRFDFAGHLRIVLPWLLGLQLASLLQEQLAAALGWPWLWHAAGPVQALLAALLLRAHLVHLLPLHGRVVGAGIATLVLVGSSLSAALSWRSNDSVRPAPYMSTLPLPALRVGSSTPPQALVGDMAPLAEALAQRVQKARQEDARSGESGDDSTD